MLNWTVCVSFYFFVFMLRILPSVLSVDLMQHFHLCATQLGSLSSLSLATYALLQVPSGIFIDKMSLRVLVLSSLALCIAGTGLILASDSLGILYLSRLFVGAGSASGFLATSKITVLCFAPEKTGLMLGLTLTIGTLGALFGGKPLVLLSEALGWQQAIKILCFFGCALWIVNFFFLKPPRLKPTQKKREPVLTPLFLSSLLSAVAVYLPVCVIADSWGVPFFIKKNIPQSSAAGLMSAVYLGIAIGSPLLAFFAEKNHSTRKIIHISVLGICALLFILILSKPLPPWFYLLPLFCIGLLAGAHMLCFSLALKTVSPENTGLAISLINFCAMGSGAFCQYAVGLFLDAFFSQTDYTRENLLTRYSLEGFQIAFIFLLALMLLLHSGGFFAEKLALKKKH